MGAKKNRAFVSWTDTELCELIVLITGRRMGEKEVARVMRGLGRPIKRANNHLRRACRELERKYMASKKPPKIAMVKEGGKTFYIDKHKIR